MRGFFSFFFRVHALCKHLRHLRRVFVVVAGDLGGLQLSVSWSLDTVEVGAGYDQSETAMAAVLLGETARGC